jgi:hypothetical protein
MNAMMVIVMLELYQLSLQVAGSPEKCVVKIFSGNGSDQSFYEGMRDARVEYVERFLSPRHSGCEGLLSINGIGKVDPCQS